MKLRTRLFVAAFAGLAALPALAQTRPIRIGVLSDQSGVFADYQRAVLTRRADRVAALYADPPSPEIIAA